MEAAQEKLLAQVALSRCDRRLRVWRESALRLFEDAWAKASRRGLASSEEEVASLYLHCFARVLEKGRIALPSEALPDDEALWKFVRELMP